MAEIEAVALGAGVAERHATVKAGVALSRRRRGIGERDRCEGDRADSKRNKYLF